MFARTAVGIVCASALATAGAAPAMAAQQDRHHHALEVTVCKQVRDRHDHDGDRRNRRFEFQARTDRDSTDFRLRDHECTSFSLDFRRNSFSLEESSRNRGDSVDYRVHGDVERSESHDNQLRVRFQDSHRNRPRLFVEVTNREHDHGHGGRSLMSR